jgi:triosephosphate isomerase
LRGSSMTGRSGRCWKAVTNADGKRNDRIEMAQYQDRRTDFDRRMRFARVSERQQASGSGEVGRKMSNHQRRRIIVGNWKMHKTLEDTCAFFEAFNPLVANITYCDIVVAPPFTAIATAAVATRETRIAIGGQSMYWENEGAFTGGVSAPMLANAGCKYVIIGHSEQRQYFGEAEETISKKTKAALAAGLIPIVCVGELVEHREDGRTEEICGAQFQSAVASLAAEEFSRVLLAYEPVWAVGTGKTATPEIAASAHLFLRRCAERRYSAEVASALTILYGGSVTPGNIQGLMAEEQLDGALVGAASLDPKSFAEIVNYKSFF